MKWYEYLILIGAIIIVVAPIISYFVKKKKGTLKCECGHYVNECVGNCNACNDLKELPKKYQKNKKKITEFKYIISIEGMKCSMCESHINDIVRMNSKAIKVTSSRNKKCTIIYSKEILNIFEIKDKIEKAGYTVKSVRLT